MRIEFSEAYPDHFRVMELVEGWKNGQMQFKLHSSGSTGMPKEITLNRSLLHWSSHRTAELLQLADEDCLVVLPIERTGAFMQVIRAAEFQWNLHVQPPHSNPLAQIETEHRFTLCSMSPMQLHYSLENELKKLKRFRTILVGGAAVEDGLEERALRLTEGSGLRLVETFGMTETASHIALRHFGQPLFQPLPGVLLDPREDHLNIRIPELDFAVRSTDRIQMEANGFKPIGRADQVINSGGIKIHPELEEPHVHKLLNDMGIMRPFYLSSQKDPLLGEVLVLVLPPPALKDRDFVLEYLRRNCRKHHAPRAIIHEEIGYTDTGKILRRKW